MAKSKKAKSYKAPIRVRRVVDGKDVITKDITYLRVKKVLGKRTGRDGRGNQLNFTRVFLEDGSTREYLTEKLVEVKD